MQGSGFSSFHSHSAGSFFRDLGDEVPIDNFPMYAKEKLKSLTEQVFAFKPDCRQKAKAEIEQRRLISEISQCSKTLRM